MKKPTVPDQLPTVYPYIVDKLALELRDREQTRRIPVATARVLILMVKLHEKNHVFPARELIAKHLDVSVQTVDAVLSQRQATRDIRIVHVALKGSKQARLATIRGRRIIPSAFLCKLVKQAEVENARAHLMAHAAIKPKSKRKARAEDESLGAGPAL